MQQKNTSGKCIALIENEVILRSVKAGPLLAKRRRYGLRKAAAEDKVHGVTQQSPIYTVANRL